MFGEPVVSSHVDKLSRDTTVITVTLPSVNVASPTLPESTRHTPVKKERKEERKEVPSNSFHPLRNFRHEEFVLRYNENLSKRKRLVMEKAEANNESPPDVPLSESFDFRLQQLPLSEIVGEEEDEEEELTGRAQKAKDIADRKHAWHLAFPISGYVEHTLTHLTIAIIVFALIFQY